MKDSFQLFFSKKWVSYSFIILAFSGLLLVLFIDKETLHLSSNQYHTPFFDVFFKYATYLGDGIIYPIVIIGLLIFHKKTAPAFLYAGIITLLISYVLKNWVFIGYARPYTLLKDTLHLIEGVKMRSWHSFPSGHTTAAFSLFILAVLFTKKTSSQLLWFLLAIIAGISRVYLSQHFLRDVIGGSILGTFIALASYQLYLHYPLFKK